MGRAVKAPPLVVIHGADAFRIRQALAEVEAEALAGADPSVNRQVFTAPDADPAEVVNAARTLPFLAGRRLVVVKDAHRWNADAWNRILPYLEHPNPSTCLVFVAEKLDRRSKAGRLLAERARVVACDPPRESELPAWIARAARQAGLRLGPEVVQALILRAGTDLELLSQEIEKLRAFAGEGGRVGLDDLERLVGESRTVSVFALCDALGLRDLAGALRALRRLLGLGEPPVRLLYMLARHVRLLWIAREALDRPGRPDPRAVAGDLGVPPFVARKLLDQARRWSVPGLRDALALLVRTDLALKTGSGPEALERLVIRLCRPNGSGSADKGPVTGFR